MRYIIVGLTDDTRPVMDAAVLDAIDRCRLFSGGMRQHIIVAPLLPIASRWIDIVAPIDDLLRQYEEAAEEEMMVFASGDPLFYGIAATIRAREPEAPMTIYPVMNSLATLAHRLLMPYHDMRMLSLTGRPWHLFDGALIEGCGKIGILTDRDHTPRAIADRMMSYGYGQYVMHIGERLGGGMERVTTMSLADAARYDAATPNCVIVEGTPRERRWGIDDTEIEGLPGRPGMMTKKPIRLLTIEALDLRRHDMLVDVGFCTGSVSIEAKLQFPHIAVVAVEVREECRQIMTRNMRRHGAAGISVVTGDFMDYDIGGLDAVYTRITGLRRKARKAFFIGGHGGMLAPMMARIAGVMARGDVMVMNSVAEQSRRVFEQAAAATGLRMAAPMEVTIDHYNMITIMKCEKD